MRLHSVVPLFPWHLDVRIQAKKRHSAHRFSRLWDIAVDAARGMARVR